MGYNGHAVPGGFDSKTPPDAPQISGGDRGGALRVAREIRGGSVRVPIAPALSVDRAEVVAEAQPEAAAQRGTTLGRPPNDHDLSIALGEHIVVVNGHGACNAESPLSNVVVGISEPRLLNRPR